MKSSSRKLLSEVFIDFIVVTMLVGMFWINIFEKPEGSASYKPVLLLITWALAMFYYFFSFWIAKRMTLKTNHSILVGTIGIPVALLWTMVACILIIPFPLHHDEQYSCFLVFSLSSVILYVWMLFRVVVSGTKARTSADADKENENVSQPSK